MAEAIGPVFTGGFVQVVKNDAKGSYTILFLPDKNNQELQNARQAPVYYYLPREIRIAQRPSTGDYKFSLIHFVGQVGGPESNNDIEAGGVFAVTLTSALPDDVLEQAQNELIERFRGDGDRYWGWRSNVTPMFRPIPVMANQTAITNLAPTAEGLPPAPTTPTTDPQPGETRSLLNLRPSPNVERMMVHGRNFVAPRNVDVWYWRLQGQGAGAIVPTGEFSFSGLVGSIPAAILWQGFHGVYSPIVITQLLKLKLWSQSISLTIDCDWQQVYAHFSTHVQGGAWIWHADVKAAFNYLTQRDIIRVHLMIDGTAPDADKLREEVNKRKEMILQKFLEIAKQTIFDAQPKRPEPAAASGGGGIFGWGVSVALKAQVDFTSLKQHYEEIIDEQYLHEHANSSSLEGFFNEIKADPANEKKYFSTIYLDDWERNVTRIARPIANWRNDAQKWVGDPIDSLAVQIGYPSENGDIRWTSHLFTPNDATDTNRWEMRTSIKRLEDVARPPSGTGANGQQTAWTPDMTFVKRQILLQEPPGEDESPYFRAFVERNIIDIDPAGNGTMTNNNILEVRADAAGKLEVGPIMLNVVLDDPKQFVEVTFQANGNKADGTPRNPTRFRWQLDDQRESRYWEIFTGQPDFLTNFRYQVRVVVQGSLFSEGMEWTGPWVDASGNGPLMVRVPHSDGPAVTRKSMLPSMLAANSEAFANQLGSSSQPVTAGGTTLNGNGTMAGGLGSVPIGPPPAITSGNSRNAEATRASVRGFQLAPTEGNGSNRGIRSLRNGKNGNGDHDLIDPNNETVNRDMIGESMDESNELELLPNGWVTE